MKYTTHGLWGNYVVETFRILAVFGRHYWRILTNPDPRPNKPGMWVDLDRHRRGYIYPRPRQGESLWPWNEK